jgi:hypothetical protein
VQWATGATGRHALAAMVDHPDLDAAARIEPGTVAAMRFSASAVVDGRPALTVEHITRLAPDVAPDWPRGRGWRVTVEGVPSMVLEAKIAVHGEDENDQGCLGTAMHAVVDGGRLLVGGETADLFGTCDANELTAHFDDLAKAAGGRG